MSTIRVLVVDDEPLARRGIRQLLAPHADVQVVGEARNGREAVSLVAALAPDVVFLDVQMPELDGFAVLRELAPGRLPCIVFVTAYDTFAVRAFESHALDYLVKPIQEARFEDALARVRERIEAREAMELSRRQLRRLAQQPPRRIVIGTAAADLVLDVTEIASIEADDYYAAIHASGRRHLVRESLASLEQRLAEAQFVRVHRSALVNLAQVREVRAHAGGEAAVVLRDGTELPLSRRRREQVMEAVRRFAG
jgi:two-component system LytT family response regulator